MIIKIMGGDGMLRLNIEQTSAKLALNIQAPFLEMSTTQPQIQIETEAATLEIRQPNGVLEIDQYPSRASYGYKNVFDQTRQLAEEARQTVLEMIGRVAQNGDRMARIESGENAIAAISEEESYSPPPQVEITPVARPIIRYHVRAPEFNSTTGRVDVSLQRGTVETHLRWGTVSPRIAQYNSIRMWTTGSRVDIKQ
jgi:hypothetical protein